MIYEHSRFHDGTPFFDETDWVGFVQRSQRWSCNPFFIETVIYPSIVDITNLKATQFKNFQGTTEEVDLDGQPMSIGLTNAEDIEYQRFQFIAYPFYITSDINAWRLVIVPDEAEPLFSYFLWGGTREMWARFRPHLEALPSTIPIESRELDGRDPRQWVFTKTTTEVPDIVMKGLGPVKLAGDLGLSWE